MMADTINVIMTTKFNGNIYLFYLVFFSPTFTNHRAAGEGGGHFCNSSLPLPAASQTI